jgi:hypothetical protein
MRFAFADADGNAEAVEDDEDANDEDDEEDDEDDLNEEEDEIKEEDEDDDVDVDDDSLVEELIADAADLLSFFLAAGVGFFAGFAAPCSTTPRSATDFFRASST